MGAYGSAPSPLKKVSVQFHNVALIRYRGGKVEDDGSAVNGTKGVARLLSHDIGELSARNSPAH
jgi:hypothetical protein